MHGHGVSLLDRATEPGEIMIHHGNALARVVVAIERPMPAQA
jgi:hypothetical protein